MDPGDSNAFMEDTCDDVRSQLEIRCVRNVGNVNTLHISSSSWTTQLTLKIPHSFQPQTQIS